MMFPKILLNLCLRYSLLFFTFFLYAYTASDNNDRVTELSEEEKVENYKELQENFQNIENKRIACCDRLSKFNQMCKKKFYQKPMVLLMVSGVLLILHFFPNRIIFLEKTYLYLAIGLLFISIFLFFKIYWHNRNAKKLGEEILVEENKVDQCIVEQGITEEYVRKTWEDLRDELRIGDKKESFQNEIQESDMEKSQSQNDLDNYMNDLDNYMNVGIKQILASSISKKSVEAVKVLFWKKKNRDKPLTEKQYELVAYQLKKIFDPSNSTMQENHEVYREG